MNLGRKKSLARRLVDCFDGGQFNKDITRSDVYKTVMANDTRHVGLKKKIYIKILFVVSSYIIHPHYFNRT